MHEKWIAFASRLVAEWRKIVAGEVLIVVAMIAHHQGWILTYIVASFVSGYLLTVALCDAAWPEDPGTAKKHTRRW